MLKILRVVGARPQFMQAAILRQELDKRGHKEILVHTGQHYDPNMSKLFFDELNIPYPDYNLEVGSAPHGAQTGLMLKEIEQVIRKTKPDAVVVDGDTNSTLAGALAAVKLHVPVVHIEAGMRSFNKKMPEEINRIMVDHISVLLCAPTKQAMANLTKEGLEERTVLTGDLMYDCFLFYQHKAKNDILDAFELQPKKYVLATLHRAENTNNVDLLAEIFEALLTIPYKIIFPCHPRTANFLKKCGKYNNVAMKNILFIDPVSYLEMIALEKNALFILTDSGGVQREAFFSGTKSIIIREQTEWVEQVEMGWSILGYNSKEKILDAMENISKPTQKSFSIYGNGKAAEKIVDAIEREIL
jgi:UDP-N-acetylglucosamine 2-epimerase